MEGTEKAPERFHVRTLEKVDHFLEVVHEGTTQQEPDEVNTAYKLFLANLGQLNNVMSVAAANDKQFVMVAEYIDNLLQKELFNKIK